MNGLKQTIFLVCGLLFTLAAVPVFAQQTADDSVRLNKRPLEDLAVVAIEKQARNKIDLTKNFSIELEGVLQKDGKLDPNKSKFINQTGDAEMIEIGKTAIEAANDSGFLQYLKNLDVEKINLKLVQDDSQVSVGIVSELKSSRRAQSIASTLNLIIKLSLMPDKEGKTRAGEDGKFLLQRLIVRGEDKMLVMTFAYEKSVVHELISRKLKEVEAKKSASE